MANTTNELSTTRPDRATQNLPEVNSEDPAVLRAEIERNRAQMGRTIDEIQTRLSPSYVKQQTQEAIRETITEKVDQMTNEAEYRVRRLRRSTMETVKENPVPVAMIGIGLGWLLLSNRSDDDGDDYDYYGRRYYGTAGDPYFGEYPPEHRGVYYEEDQGMVDRVTDRTTASSRQAREWTEDKVRSAQETASDTARRAQDTAHDLAQEARVRRDRAAEAVSSQASETAEQARQRAREMRQRARMTARRTKRSALDTFYENPLAVGVAAVAAGALVGMALPSTAKEDEWMGETRDQMIEEAKATAQRSAQQVRAVAEQAGEAAMEEAKREADRQGMDVPAKSETRSHTTTEKTTNSR